MQFTNTPVQQQKYKIGILMVNLGTPDAPDKTSVRRYLKQFLSDPRVIEKPRWLWWLILNLIILRVRPARTARAYKKVWSDAGSPILLISRLQAAKLQARLNDIDRTEVKLELAMRYGQPSIDNGITILQKYGISKLLILPMYPQYCASTTASVFDEVANQLKKRRWIPEARFINHYYNRTDYIRALANSVRRSWAENGRGDILVVSFHGIPKSYISHGDPYLQHCEETTTLLKNSLQLTDEQIKLVFQSRVGTEEWLKPYCDHTLKLLPSQGINNIDIISPAFSADCLETLEELEVENRAYFMEAGGERYQYISALNEGDEHIEVLGNLVEQHIQGWVE